MVCHNQSIYIRLAVVIVFLVSFTLYGIEGIGEEIEDPFGKDENGNILLYCGQLTQISKSMQCLRDLKQNFGLYLRGLMFMIGLFPVSKGV